MFNSIADLKLFAQIYERRNLSQVAELAQTTPGVISKRLSQLEADFGARLFHRTTRNIQPTDEGQRLFVQAQNLLELVETYENEWGEKTEPSGTIRITASASFARLYLMPLMTQFVKRYPQIRISFELSDKVLDIVAEGIDLAIRGALMNDSSLIARKLGPSPEVLCATRKYLAAAPPLTCPADLAQHNCIVLNENYNWEFRQDDKIIHQKVSGNFQTNYSEALVAAIKDDLGIGMVCYWQIHEEIKSGALELVLPHYHPGRLQSLYAVYPSRRHLPLKTKVLVRFLEEHLTIPSPVGTNNLPTAN
ncbi:MAG TPA: LysR family transcriptional regulator [Methylophilaceae bacterium]|jgi:DNA-binding transcriptional LysR family regulator|nr:LysR family transcriptional regulator [Methylophilaceae bacterium]